MKKNAGLAFLAIALILPSLTAYSQDSLKLVPIKAWQLSRMIDAVKYGRVCDSLTVRLDSTVQGLKTALQAGQQLIDLRTQERDLKVAEVEKADSIANNTDAIHKSELKAEKRKGNKKLGVGFILGFVLAALLI